MKREILKLGKQHPLNSELIYIKKRLIFEKFRELCEPKNIKFGDFTDCDNLCKRNCLEKDSINNVLESIKYNSAIIDRDSKGSILFDENISFLFFISIPDNTGKPYKLIDKYTVTGFRKVEFVDRNLNITGQKVSTRYEEIGKVELLKIDIAGYLNLDNYEYKNIKINHLFEKGWQGDKFYDLQIIEYSQYDIVNEYHNDYTMIFPIPVYASYIFGLGEGGISYCGPPTTNYFYGVLDFIIRF